MKKNLAESGESDELEDGDDEALPTKSELEWIILKYLQPIHRYPYIGKQTFESHSTLDADSLQTFTHDWQLWKRSWGWREAESRRARIGRQEKTRKYKNLVCSCCIKIDRNLRVKLVSLSLPFVVI